MSDDFFAALDPAIALRYWPALAAGLGTTIFITASSFLTGLVLAVFLTILRRSRHAVLRAPATGFEEVFRGTPLLVQAVWLHFALPALTHVSTTPLQSGIIALSLNTAAYAAEIIRAGVESVPVGQIEAAHALGLRRSAVWLKVILPQAARAVLPPLSGFLVSVIKGSALLSIIAVNDLLRVATRLSNATFHPIEFFTAVALVYLAIGLMVAATTHAVERRWARG